MTVFFNCRSAAADRNNYNEKDSGQAGVTEKETKSFAAQAAPTGHKSEKQKRHAVKDMPLVKLY